MKKPMSKIRLAIILISSSSLLLPTFYLISFLHPFSLCAKPSTAATNTTAFCDTSHERYDTCFLQGDIRIISNASKLLLIISSASPAATPNATWKIKPFPRKWEAPVMARTKQLSIITSETPAAPCTINHTAPAVVFSTGGFSGNFYHDITDILIPLYVTSHRFHGDVKFLVSDFNAKFVAKYRPVLARLSGSDVINLDGDNGVHCFREVHVGLINNKEFGIDTTKPPPGISMNGFRQFLRSSFSLSRNRVARNRGRRKPRLLIQLRKGSRELVNSREVISMTKRLGFKVIVAGAEDTKNLTSFSAAVNSVDALLGVHGAGLSNMVFLPDGAAVVQIIPWGGLKWACRFSFGDPAAGMGLKYFEYEIKEEESSLIEQYPRNHSVFTNPAEIHKQGWNMLWYVFLEKQRVKVDLRRLRAVLAEVLRWIQTGEEKNLHFMIQ
ncbi:hypothetical protein KSP39_PZI005496 [Platanthera zijinensis]|uniref:Glycosyltransferase 61 catalytic domain-containing protein n=1 Tax=Platanthera zijinensis TaxID=2320716 RepID=A0AAP0BUD5_9ASPA